MELRFVEVESAFDYFEATRSYLRRHGKPVAFYSDKHSVFRVVREGTTGRGGGITQFGRALGELNIDIICANTPQAKGRVERMNRSLQDRLVKELRLRGISALDIANAFAPSFVDDFNARFARPPKNPHDAHRPLRADEDLERIFTWQETRTMSRNLVVHYRRATYLIDATDDTRRLAGAKRRVDVHESVDGEVDIRYEGRSLPYTVFEKRPLIASGDIVENKRLGVVLGVVKEFQDRRDEARLRSPKLSLRGKERLRAARAAVGVAPDPATAPASLPLAAPVAAYIESFIAEQQAKRKRENARTNDRKRAREVAEALHRARVSDAGPSTDLGSSTRRAAAPGTGTALSLWTAGRPPAHSAAPPPQGCSRRERLQGQTRNSELDDVTLRVKPDTSNEPTSGHF
jgi:hypothetical protein